ncbi:glycosyltransferase family 2 protein [Methylobacterium sp. J-076]|uniref:glycosyltransferase family 2 protein n=1 Tax=Methylobacterium sp. J-076 TaxID=2836655 RepID=UPI001FBA71EF|nr:glycosyltransferase [Methylobacterium sp. J-076]MCJ2013893.1 glycosyltransferase [Methylobacterium sp. J-076]
MPRLPPEIAFLAAQGADPRLLAQAVSLAEAAGTDAATALLHTGLMDEETYYRSLARALGARFLDGPVPFGGRLAYPDCLVAGLAPLAPGAGAAAVIAPRGPAVADLLGGAGRGGGPAITTPTRLREAVFAAVPEAVAGHAAGALRRCAPETAARPPGPGLLVLALILGAALCLHAAAPGPVAQAATVAGQATLLALTAFRIAALAIPPPPAEAPPLPEAALPVYTVLVPLYREGRVVPRLLRGLAALDYPAAKLDIKILLEADDRETAALLAAIPLPARFEVVTVPPGQPRTKPRALNAALPLARGSLLVVYDAEDVPEPDQLRKAAAIFAAEPPDTACLQGRLVIDDHGDGLLPKLFAAEYAGLFDVLNPALAALDLPLPLGGTTMHLRTRVLRELGGWDAHNVAEDADLGIRLALAGYHVGDLPSATYEETAKGLRRWLAQRTRWLKGFLQTSLVHGRRPLAGAARLGPLGSLCAVALLPGTVASALAYPVCFVAAVAAFLSGGIGVAPTFCGNLGPGLALTLFLAGLVALIGPAALGCRRRGWRDLWPLLPLMPAYFFLVSLAALQAVDELIRAPHRWNKTEHGLSRSSRSGKLTGGGPQRNGGSGR